MTRTTKELAGIRGVEAACLFGSFAARMRGGPGPAPADIDVMVIGTPDSAEVYDVCDRVGDAVRRPVNPTILTREEASAESAFLTHVRASPTVPIIGEVPWPSPH